MADISGYYDNNGNWVRVSGAPVAQSTTITQPTWDQVNAGNSKWDQRQAPRDGNGNLTGYGYYDNNGIYIPGPDDSFETVQTQAGKSRTEVNNMLAVQGGNVGSYVGADGTTVRANNALAPGALDLNPAAYQMNGLTFDAAAGQINTVNNIAARDPRAFDVGVNTQLLPQTIEGTSYKATGRVDPDQVTYDRAKAATIDWPDTYNAQTLGTRQINNAFQGTDRQLDAANAAYQQGYGGVPRGVSEQTLIAAALGEAPSAAEAMYGRAQADYQNQAVQAGLDYRTQSRAAQDSLARQQMSLAASARGDSAGLALLNAQNQTAMGQAQLAQQALDAYQKQQLALQGTLAQGSYGAAATRAEEMAQARAALSGYDTASRGVDVNVAQGMAGIANTQQTSDAQRLAARQQDLAALNAGAQFNVSNKMDVLSKEAAFAQQANLQNSAQSLQASTTNAANQMTVNEAEAAARDQAKIFAATQQYNANAANAANMLDANKTTLGYNVGIATDNANRAVQYQQQNDVTQVNTLQNLVGIGQSQQAADIQHVQDQAANIQQGLTRSSNYLQGQATNTIAANNNLQMHDDRVLGAAMGAAGSGMATVASIAGRPQGSDEDMKNVGSKKPPADFSRTQNAEYTYKDPTNFGADARKHVGPMAQQLPKEVVAVGPDGYKVVDINALALSLASAVGDLQRDKKRSN